MEGFMFEKPKVAEQIDLTLKLSPCGQSAEEKCLTKSATIAGEKEVMANGPQKEGPIVARLKLKRSTSLPPHAKKSILTRLETSKTMPERWWRATELIEAAKSSDLANIEGGASSSAQTSSKHDIDNPVKMLTAENPRPNDETMKVWERMPMVTTSGDGPYERRIHGILYNYEQGEVCILCACHASFLTPSEFVIHAGGSKVENPMKYITVLLSNSF
ncbi:hypothetical protein RIF29_07905 [Crotalaria pallida]|uniref:Ninja-family protein n=1 Tax=Crotalaria pallida TaxID=3830 RepID=A0AAN9J7E6_CROPI